METLQERMKKAMDRIGGPLAVLALPDQVRDVIVNCPVYEIRVQMLELVADQLKKRRM